MPGIICPVVAYAPKAATKPSIAAQPLNFSASGVIIVILVDCVCSDAEGTKEK